MEGGDRGYEAKTKGKEEENKVKRINTNPVAHLNAEDISRKIASYLTPNDYNILKRTSKKLLPNVIKYYTITPNDIIQEILDNNEEVITRNNIREIPDDSDMGDLLMFCIWSNSTLILAECLKRIDINSIDNDIMNNVIKYGEYYKIPKIVEYSNNNFIRNQFTFDNIEFDMDTDVYVSTIIQTGDVLPIENIYPLIRNDVSKSSYDEKKVSRVINEVYDNAVYIIYLYHYNLFDYIYENNNSYIHDMIRNTNIKYKLLIIGRDDFYWRIIYDNSDEDTREILKVYSYACGISDGEYSKQEVMDTLNKLPDMVRYSYKGDEEHWNEYLTEEFISRGATNIVPNVINGKISIDRIADTETDMNDYYPYLVKIQRAFMSKYFNYDFPVHKYMNILPIIMKNSKERPRKYMNHIGMLTSYLGKLEETTGNSIFLEEIMRSLYREDSKYITDVLYNVPIPFMSEIVSNIYFMTEYVRIYGNREPIENIVSECLRRKQLMSIRLRSYEYTMKMLKIFSKYI
jgi:hypothetical protein